MSKMYKVVVSYNSSYNSSSYPNDEFIVKDVWGPISAIDKVTLRLKEKYADADDDYQLDSICNFSVSKMEESEIL